MRPKSLGWVLTRHQKLQGENTSKRKMKMTREQHSGIIRYFDFTGIFFSSRGIAAAATAATADDRQTDRALRAAVAELADDLWTAAGSARLGFQISGVWNLRWIFYPSKFPISFQIS